LNGATSKQTLLKRPSCKNPLNPSGDVGNTLWDRSQQGSWLRVPMDGFTTCPGGCYPQRSDWLALNLKEFDLGPPLGIRQWVGVPPETRCKYIPVISEPASLLATVSGGTPTPRRIARDWIW